MKTVKAVAPYSHGINFKMQVYDAWVKTGGQTMKGHYPWRMFHRFAFNYELPTIHKSDKVAQLRFVEPVSINLDTFPDYARYEIIPFVWDCWPGYFDKTCEWFKRHEVRTAIFTSSQTSERMRQRFPDMNILTITEGININLYDKGEELKERIIKVYEIGSVQRGYFKKKYSKEYASLYNAPTDWDLATTEGFKKHLENTKLTVIFPKSMTEPDTAQGIETLTQRYWECMLSRIVMVGHAPKELTDLLGYNPVIELNRNSELAHINHILDEIDEPKYQNLVDKNRNSALQYASWNIRMSHILTWLKEVGYNV